MKRTVAAVVFALTGVGYAATCGAVPATDDTSKAIKVITGQKKMQKPANERKKGRKEGAATGKQERMSSAGGKAAPARK